MATKTPTHVPSPSAGDGSVVQFNWELTTADSDGAPFSYAEWADVCITATGTFGAGTLTMEGSNDGATWLPLSNAAGGTAATATSNKVMQIIERPLYMRPNLTGSTGATVTVIATLRRAQPLRT